jgi:hypothetical protein
MSRVETEEAMKWNDSDRGEAPSRVEPEQLELRVDAIRNDLGGLIGELDRRRHRVGKPLIAAAATTAGCALGLGTFLIVRRRRARSHRSRGIVEALRRAVAHPERVAPPSREPLARKILTAAAASVASVAARRAAQRLLASRRAASRIPTSTDATAGRNA